MKEIARSYFQLGLNVFSISNLLSLSNYFENNRLKSPFNSCNELSNRRQRIDEFKTIPWAGATGLGCMLGYNSLGAIDIDGAIGLDIVKTILYSLSLPQDYKWVFITGSQCGYHILFKYINNIDAQEFSRRSEGIPYLADFFCSNCNAYYPFEDRISSIKSFSKIEFKWQGNVVLPPSIHSSGQLYSLLNGFPDYEPAVCKLSDLLSLKDGICSLQANSSEVGTSTTEEGWGIIEQRSSYKIASADHTQFCYRATSHESHIGFHIVHKIIDKENYSIILSQISWFVLDSNMNVVKRKSFNYLTKNRSEFLVKKKIKSERAKLIIEDKRLVFYEFVFDLMHSNKIFCYNEVLLDEIKYEIQQSGFFLDGFLKKYFITQNRLGDFLYDKHIIHMPEYLKDVVFVSEICDKENWNKPEILTTLENYIEEEKTCIHTLTCIYKIFVIVTKKLHTKNRSGQ